MSAHRTPKDMAAYGEEAHQRGLKVIIAGAGSACLPGMIANTHPFLSLAFRFKSKALSGMDSLLSIVQMPAGIPVATVAIGNAQNAGLLAISILGSQDAALRDKILAYKEEMAEASRMKTENLT